MNCAEEQREVRNSKPKSPQKLHHADKKTGTPAEQIKI